MNPLIAVFSGGISMEREVSRRSAEAVAAALKGFHEVEVFDITESALPAELDPTRHVVFSALHGIFGEDGGMQSLLEASGFSFAGSVSAASRLCMDKDLAKQTARAAGVRVAPGLFIPAGESPDAAAVTAELGDRLVIKPNSEGSSIGLHFVRGPSGLADLWTGLESRAWLVEKQIQGRELTVGLLHGRAMGVVEILPRSGVFDYQSKYTKGLTRYEYPARLPGETGQEVGRLGEAVFQACGCRDFARADFMLSEEGELFFLEINTIPGLTETSLLPKSASCDGMDFATLAAELVAPAIRRFQEARGKIAS